jgi:hypothetical protein
LQVEQSQREQGIVQDPAQEVAGQELGLIQKQDKLAQGPQEGQENVER